VPEVESIEQTMTGDHARCDELFASAEDAVSDGDWEQGSVRFAAFNDAVERHFRMEEEILFPGFESATGTSAGPTEIMRSEHAQMRNLLYSMSVALELQDQDEYLGCSETLLIIMQQHNAKEEQVLYPTADQLMGPDVGIVIRSMDAVS